MSVHGFVLRLAPEAASASIWSVTRDARTLAWWNVATKAGGAIIGGSGGHADTAAAARLTAAGYAKIVPAVGTLTTPGSTEDVVVTDAGIAVNPLRGDLAERLRAARLPVVDIEALADKAAAAATRATPSRSLGRVVAVSEFRYGSVTDVVRQIEE